MSTADLSRAVAPSPAQVSGSPRVHRRAGVMASLMAIGVVAAGGAGLIGARVASASRLAPAGAPIIAVVDLEEIINKLKEREDRVAEMEANARTMNAKLKALEDELKLKRDELQAMGDGAGRKEARQKLQELLFRGEFEKQFALKQLGEQSIEVLRNLYLKVDLASEALAKKNGYDLVMVSDEKAPIPADDEAAMRRAMLLKRMLYVNPTLDITQELIQTMNNEYAAGK